MRPISINGVDPQTTRDVLRYIPLDLRGSHRDDILDSVEGNFGQIIEENETNLRESLQVFPNLRSSFTKIASIDSKIKKISALALAIILTPLRVVQDIYYHVKQLIRGPDFPNYDAKRRREMEVYRLLDEASRRERYERGVELGIIRPDSFETIPLDPLEYDTIAPRKYNLNFIKPSTD